MFFNTHYRFLFHTLLCDFLTHTPPHHHHHMPLHRYGVLAHGDSLTPLQAAGYGASVGGFYLYSQRQRAAAAAAGGGGGGGSGSSSKAKKA